MNYLIEKNKIIVKCDEFNPTSIFECGQTFSYKKFDDVYVAYPESYLAVVYKDCDCYIIECLIGDVKYFINYFDLDNDYSKIISKINDINLTQNDLDRRLISESLKFGVGIRILKQEIVETIISFIFSANNNIKRFKASLDNLRKDYGVELKVNLDDVSKNVREIFKKEKFYSFPKLNVLKNLSLQYFLKIGAGYRANYLIDTIKKLDEFFKEDFDKLKSDELLKMILQLKGVGGKVGQCVLLFGFGRTDVFPVDTWIKQIYEDLNIGEEKKSVNEISKHLISIFKEYSGYAQQYLFYYKREIKNLNM